MKKKSNTVFFIVETSMPSLPVAEMENYISVAIHDYQNKIGISAMPTHMARRAPWPNNDHFVKARQVTRRRAKWAMAKLRSIVGITLWDDIVCKIRNL